MAVAVAGVVVAIGLGALLVLTAGRNPNQVRLGDDVYKAGRTDRLAAEVADRGPILVADASPRRERDIYVQHLGDADDEGWLAFAAQAEGADRECFVRWSPDDEEFVDPCSGERYPADGEGLHQYDVTVTDGRIEIALN